MLYFSWETIGATMKKWPLLFLMPLLLFACKGKKKQLSDDDALEPADFIAYFDEIKLPVYLADSSFTKKDNDSVIISSKAFARFVPDTLLSRHFGKGLHPKLYPEGKVSVKNQETYLFVKAAAPGKKSIFVLVFDKDKKFVVGMPLVTSDDDERTQNSAGMDSKYTITTNQAKKAASGIVYRKKAYVFNSAGVFTLILTESNDVASVKNILINPIDTLPRKNKLSGDYTQDKINIVSFRDGRNASELIMFVHFEKDGGNCRGELKGEVKVQGSNKAVFHRSGDQCILEFVFNGNSVTMKEEAGCGSHRDIKCFFEGTYTRKASPKAAKARKK